VQQVDCELRVLGRFQLHSHAVDTVDKGKCPGEFERDEFVLGHEENELIPADLGPRNYLTLVFLHFQYFQLLQPSLLSS
jgi:hypothetical protein